jgi:2-polyprenyl-3-methyl-5-hydroxy-6-metoxy-1,4-benzoquinol methylase
MKEQQRRYMKRAEDFCREVSYASADADNSLIEPYGAKEPKHWQSTVNDELAFRWKDFVNCTQRLKSEQRFLLDLLGRLKQPRVFDAAMGTGCETIWLTLHGVNTLGNEISRDLRAVAGEEADRKGATLKVKSVDWKEMGFFFEREQFDLILLLGNSLSLLKNRGERRLVAENLRAISKKHGIVVIDERNFRYILQDRESILKGKFRYTGRVIYCGKKVIGKPVRISESCVTFGYFDASSGRCIGKLDMYPFKEGELIDLFLKVGFRNVEVYSDLRLRFDPNADFYTYVFSA